MNWWGVEDGSEGSMAAFWVIMKRGQIQSEIMADPTMPMVLSCGMWWWWVVVMFWKGKEGWKERSMSGVEWSAI